MARACGRRENMACKLPIDDITKAVSGAVSSALSKIEDGSSSNSSMHYRLI